jgi:hypothetical protein
MPPVDYIVRIYRYEKSNPRKLVGTVEEVGADGKKAFVNLDELWKILNCTASTSSDMPTYLLG